MDIEYLLWLQGLRESAPEFLQSLIAFLGAEWASYIAMAMPAVVYWCVDRRRGIVPFFSFMISLPVNQLVKLTACSYRPWVRDPRIHPDERAIPFATGYSFPSAHTQSSASLLGGMGWAWRDRARWPFVATIGFTIVMGLSRNILGVHTPQDVVVGFALGLGLMLAAERLLVWAESRDGYDLRLVLALVLCCCGLLAYVSLKSYPMDYVDGTLLVDPQEMIEDCYSSVGVALGTAIGWLLERRLVHFETDGLDLRHALVRLAVGVAVLLVVHVLLGHLLVAQLGNLKGQLVRYLLTFLCVVAGCPALFVRLGR
jgi:membrane-associated phospholipid phosphatase